MAVAPLDAPAHRRVQPWELVVTFLVVDAVFLAVVHALGNPLAYDFGFYYRGGVAAWEHGTPTAHPGWVGTPFAAAVLAPLTQVAGLATASRLVTLVNLAIVAMGATAVWQVFRARLAPGWAVVATAATTCLYAPVFSTILWRQLNLVVLALAVVGFVQVRRDRTGWGAVLLGLSVAIKPLLVLVPLGLLLRRETRRAGVLAMGWIVALSVAGQGFLAWRAQDLGLLVPWRAYRTMTQPLLRPQGSVACHPGNISLQGTACRFFGTEAWNARQVLVPLVATGIAAVVLWAVRRCSARSFEYFAVLAATSTFFGPVAWTHYHVVLVPILVVTAVHLCRRPRRIPILFLLGGWSATMLAWSPTMTLANWTSDRFGGTPIHDSFVLMRIANVGALVVLGTACVVFRDDAARRPERVDEHAFVTV